MRRKIHVFPAWESNPYLNMLYIGARAEGWQVEGTKNLEALAAAAPELMTGDVFHIHWTSPILGASTSYGEAQRALTRFTAILSAFRGRGVHVVWTVHNIFTHDAPHPELEADLASELSKWADRIIQLNSSTRVAVSEFYELPEEKIFTLPHASYAGIYPEPPSQSCARGVLGIPTSASVVGFVGQMRAYKGIPTLLGAVSHAATRRSDLALVLAGKTPPDDIPKIERELPNFVPVMRHHSFISDGEIGTWFAACDVMVFPYERVLNSGSVLLSATFARPCILPREPHLLAEYGDQEWVSFYETGENKVAALAVAIEDSLASSVAAQKAAKRFSESYSTLHMSRDYLALIEELTSSTVRPVEGL